MTPVKTPDGSGPSYGSDTPMEQPLKEEPPTEELLKTPMGAS